MCAVWATWLKFPFFVSSSFFFATRTTPETLTAIANLGQINRGCKELGKASSMCQLKCQFVGWDFQDIDGTSDKTPNLHGF